ncbi:MAG: VOC family protein [Rhodospirillaceae bacterium]|nr:VOC family protein [Rhodospirillaceae bacterium]
MLDHVSIGVKDIEASKRFYDATLKPLGYVSKYAKGTDAGYGRDGIQLWLGQTDKPVKEDMASGLHFCFVAPTRKSVDDFYAAGLKAGGRDNGKPGIRPNYGPTYYAAFVIDPDGYRIEAHCSAAE